MTTNEGRVYFSLDGEAYNPEDVTSLIGLKPSKTKVKGSRIPCISSHDNMAVF